MAAAQEGHNELRRERVTLFVDEPAMGIRFLYQQETHILADTEQRGFERERTVAYDRQRRSAVARHQHELGPGMLSRQRLPPDEPFRVPTRHERFERFTV